MAIAEEKTELSTRSLKVMFCFVHKAGCIFNDQYLLRLLFVDSSIFLLLFLNYTDLENMYVRRQSPIGNVLKYDNVRYWVRIYVVA